MAASSQWNQNRAVRSMCTILIASITLAAVCLVVGVGAFGAGHGVAILGYALVGLAVICAVVAVAAGLLSVVVCIRQRSFPKLILLAWGWSIAAIAFVCLWFGGVLG